MSSPRPGNVPQSPPPAARRTTRQTSTPRCASTTHARSSRSSPPSPTGSPSFTDGRSRFCISAKASVTTSTTSSQTAATTRRRCSICTCRIWCERRRKRTPSSTRSILADCRGCPMPASSSRAWTSQGSTNAGCKRRVASRAKASRRSSPKSELASELVEALQSPVPVNGLGMKVFAAPFKGAGPNASVLVGVELRGRDLNTAGAGRVDLALSAVDVRGRAKASTHDTLTLNLRPETKTRVDQNGIRLLDRLNVPPGKYQLRVAAHDPGSGSVGSVLYDLEVPDFTKERLSISGLVLTSAAAMTAVPTARPDAELRMALPGPPVAARTFAQNDQLAIFVDVYDNDLTPVHKVDITTSLIADSGRVVLK